MLDLDWALPIKVQEAYQLRFYKTNKGHAVIYAPWCPLAWQNGQIRRSHYVLWALGVEIPEGHLVHHRDGVKLNDHPSNLEIVDRRSHSRDHGLNRSPQWKARISASLVGREVSEETRRKISLAGMGKANAAGKRSAAALENIRRGSQERERRRHEAEADLTEKVVELLAQGRSYRDVATSLGFSKDRIRRLLRDRSRP